jgi:hypothetical protein
MGYCSVEKSSNFQNLITLINIWWENNLGFAAGIPLGTEFETGYTYLLTERGPLIWK